MEPLVVAIIAAIRFPVFSRAKFARAKAAAETPPKPGGKPKAPPVRSARRKSP